MIRSWIKVKRAARLAPLALLLAAGGPSEDAPLTLPEVDHITIAKTARTMTLHDATGRVVHTIHGIQLGDAPQGHKQFQGDERTPEGRYTIDYANPNSSYHLSLHISYPNAADRAFARRQGRDPGGLIFIHGQPNWLPGRRMAGDWTDGCIAVSDEEMDALWEAVPDGTPIEITP